MLSIIKRLFGNKSKPSNEPQKPSEPSSFQKPIFAKSVACSIDIFGNNNYLLLSANILTV